MSRKLLFLILKVLFTLTIFVGCATSTSPPAQNEKAQTDIPQKVIKENNKKQIIPDAVPGENNKKDFPLISDEKAGKNEPYEKAPVRSTDLIGKDNDFKKDQSIENPILQEVENPDSEVSVSKDDSLPIKGDEILEDNLTGDSLKDLSMDDKLVPSKNESSLINEPDVSLTKSKKQNVNEHDKAREEGKASLREPILAEGEGSSSTIITNNPDPKKQFGNRKSENDLKSFFGPESKDQDLLLGEKLEDENIISKKKINVGFKNNESSLNYKATQSEKKQNIGFSNKKENEIIFEEERSVVFSIDGSESPLKTNLRQKNRRVFFRDDLPKSTSFNLSNPQKNVGFRKLEYSDNSHEDVDGRQVVFNELSDEVIEKDLEKKVILIKEEEGDDSKYGKARSYLKQAGIQKSNSSQARDRKYELSESFLNRDMAESGEKIKKSEDVKSYRFLKTLEWIENRGRSQKNSTFE